jgi:anti-sigma factor RsiW
MFDFLRDLRKSEEERRQEALSAYLDGALTPAEKRRFERLLAADEALRASLETQRMIKASMARLPRVRAPRNFTLDPALYGRPLRSTADRLYPVMRVATVVVAIVFVLVLAIDLLPFGGSMQGELAAADTMQAPAEEATVFAEEAGLAAVEEVQVVVTRVVSAEVEAEEAEGEQPAAAMPAAAEPAAEEPAAEVAEFEALVEQQTAEAPAATGLATETVAEEAAEEAAPLPGPEQASGGGGPAAATPTESTAADEAYVLTPGETNGAEPAGTPVFLTIPPAGEGAAEVTEGQQRMAGEEATALAATAEVKALAPASGLAATPEASAQPAPTVQPQAPAGSVAGSGPSFFQILVIVLGSSLVLLLAGTLVLRRRAR